MNRVVVTRMFCGLCHMQVCAEADVTDEEILKTCNSENPSGTTLGWCHVIRKDEKEPKMEPVVCNDNPERLHFMVVC